MKKTLTKNLKNAFLVILASLIIGACASTKAKDAGTVGQTQAQEQAQAQNNTVKSEVELDALIAQWYGNETNEFRKS
ncbi:MAG: hypothetical protein LBI17_01840, partial [Rickettsiales bacterium]|nr:hypothetical protein [Rickettsiales bacterium]